MLLVSVATLVVVSLLLASSTFCPGFPVCKWKSLTGIPCAGCGGTRALQSLMHGDWSGALLLNPGAVVLAAGFALASAYAAMVVVFRLPPWRPSWARRVPWRWIGLALIAANWIYLLAAGRA